MPTKLATLRTRLADLRRRRWSLRVGSGACAAGVVLLWTFVADFFIDWTFNLNRLQRFVLLAACAGVGWWLWKKYVAPALARQESDLDMALLVERQQKIDSDLVAALQFESPEAGRWGSAQLEEAVIDYVSEFGNGLNVFEGLNTNEFRKRRNRFVATAGMLLVLAALFPRHTAAFFNRFLLGSAHYPTQTEIERIAINGSEVFPNTPARPLRVPFGQSIRIDVDAGGVVPENGAFRLKSTNSGTETRVELTPQQSVSDTEQDSSKRSASFRAQSPRLTESVTYQLFLGDAWTDPALLEVIPLPVVTVDLDPVPPIYARDAKPPERQPGSRQIAVIEGSRVGMKVTCANKPLKSAKLVIGKREFPLRRENDERRLWVLAEGTPLDRVTEPVQFEVHAEDEDGLSPEQPLQGYLRIQADHAPRVVAGVVTEKVLPAAKPSIAYGATDDYGLAELRILWQITRPGGETEQSSATIKKRGANEVPQATWRGRHILDLRPFKLVKGNEVRVTLEAVDERGDRPGTSALSEPIVFQVTDESGILAGLAEADEKSAKQLDVIIQRQLGIGETK